MSADQALRRVAEEHATRGEWAQALACFQELLAQRPGDADVLLQLSYVSSLAGSYRQARDYALAAAAAGPSQTDQVLELIARLRTFNQAPALLQCLQRLGPPQRMPVPQLIGFAAQLEYLGMHGDALQLLDAALQREPDNASVLVSRGQVLTYLGRLEEAQADLVACLRRAPGITRAWLLLVGLRRQTPQSNHVQAIRNLLAQPGLRAEAVADLATALHKSLDDLGEHEGAWSALELACRAKRSTLKYRHQDSVELVEELLRMPVSAAPPVGGMQPSGQVTPIFIVGMHRSGTTLLEQLLQRHDDVRGLGELYDFTCQMREATGHHCRGVIDREIVRRSTHVDFAAVGRGYLDGLAWRLGPEQFITDKLPSNFLNVGFICRALPQARILHMRREPMDTCFSNLRELFLDANAYSYDQQELGAFFRLYERLMQHWSQAFPGRILDVDYGQLVSHPEKVMREVASFCGLPFQEQMLELRPAPGGVSTASAVAIHQGIIKREGRKWAPYERHLLPLRAALLQSGPPA